MTAALILDLQKSRSYSDKDRNNIQQYLILVTDILNEIFAERIEKKMRFNGGDEIQGLFKDQESAFLCLRMISRALHTIKYHAGIGIGEWTTIVEERDTFYQDGPVYHRARNAIDMAKKESDYTAMIVSETEHDPVLNAMLNSCYRLINSNSPYQNELAILLECRYPILQDYPFKTEALSEFLEIVKSNYGKTMDALSRFQDTIIRAQEQMSKGFTLNESMGKYIEINHPTDSVIFKYGHPYGAASELAEYTGLTRQAVDNALRKGNAYTERSVALAIIKQLRQINFES